MIDFVDRDDRLDFVHKWRDEPGAEDHHCDNEVPWDGVGRPRLDCFVCRPIDARERKSPRIVELAAQQVAAREAERAA